MGVGRNMNVALRSLRPCLLRLLAGEFAPVSVLYYLTSARKNHSFARN